MSTVYVIFFPLSISCFHSDPCYTTQTSVVVCFCSLNIIKTAYWVGESAGYTSGQYVQLMMEVRVGGQDCICCSIKEKTEKKHCSVSPYISLEMNGLPGCPWWLGPRCHIVAIGPARWWLSLSSACVTAWALCLSARPPCTTHPLSICFRTLWDITLHPETYLVMVPMTALHIEQAFPSSVPLSLCHIVQVALSRIHLTLLSWRLPTCSLGKDMPKGSRFDWWGGPCWLMQ